MKSLVAAKEGNDEVWQLNANVLIAQANGKDGLFVILRNIIAQANAKDGIFVIIRPINIFVTY